MLAERIDVLRELYGTVFGVGLIEANSPTLARKFCPYGRTRR